MRGCLGWMVGTALLAFVLMLVISWFVFVKSPNPWF